MGIGTTSPTGTLDISNGTSNIYVKWLGNTATPRLYFGGTNGVAGVINRTTAANTLYFGESTDSGGYVFRSSGPLTIKGNVGIGTTTPQFKLAVNGTIGTKEITVTNSGWADYVFKPDYRVKPLNEVSAYIKEHGRLPEIPSEKEVKEKGVSLGEMQVKLLAKIEELTLHMIQAEGWNNRLEQQNRELQGRIARLESGHVESRSR